MDSKWGGLIVAALAGLGFLCFINRESRKEVMEGESTRLKRPKHEDFLEHQVLQMKEYLEWLKTHDTQRYKEGAIAPALVGVVSVLGKINESRLKKGEKPLRFSNTEDYTRAWGKTADKIGSGGPFNRIFDKSGELKGGTVRAMSLARNKLGDRPFPSDEEAIEFFRKAYANPEVIQLAKKHGGMDGFTLDDIALWLWNEQFSYGGRKSLKARAKEQKKEKGITLSPQGFDIQTCRDWIDYFYVDATYQGFKMESEAIRKMRESYNKGDFAPIYRVVGNWGEYPIIVGENKIGRPIIEYKDAKQIWKKVGMRDENWLENSDYPLDFKHLEVVFAPDTLDMTWKVDLLVRPIESNPFSAQGTTILAGVQVKPLSFFTKPSLVEKQETKHRVVGGEGKDIKEFTPSWRHPRTVEKYDGAWKKDELRNKYYQHKGGRASNFFDVQTLVYDSDVDSSTHGEWLNYEAVMKRIQYGIKDPVLKSGWEWTGQKKDKEAQMLKIRKRFENQNAHVQEQIDKQYTEDEWQRNIVSEVLHEPGLRYQSVPYDDYPARYLATYPLPKGIGYCRKCGLERHEQKAAYKTVCGGRGKGWVCAKHPPMDTPLKIKDRPPHPTPKEKSLRTVRPSHISPDEWDKLTWTEKEWVLGGGNLPSPIGKP